MPASVVNCNVSQTFFFCLFEAFLSLGSRLNVGIDQEIYATTLSMHKLHRAGASFLPMMDLRQRGPFVLLHRWIMILNSLQAHGSKKGHQENDRYLDKCQGPCLELSHFMSNLQVFQVCDDWPNKHLSSSTLEGRLVVGLSISVEERRGYSEQSFSSSTSSSLSVREFPGDIDVRR